MSYVLFKYITDVNKTVKASRTIKYIVVHYTGNKTDTAKNNAAYFKSVNRNASAHYFVDKNTVYQSVEDKDVAWSVGKNYGNNNLFGVVTNDNSINIEMCSDNGVIANATFNNTVELVKSLMNKYKISVENVYRHYDICSKQCPGWTGWTGNDTSLWNKFKSSLATTAAVQDNGVKTQARVQLYEINNTAAQLWRPHHNSDGTVSLENVACGLYLDVEGGLTANNTIVQVYKKGKGKNQKWKLKQMEGNYAPFFTKPILLVSGLDKHKCLDVFGAGKVNGTKIDIYDINKTAAQQWAVLDHGNGTWTIINIGSLKALDVAGGGK